MPQLFCKKVVIVGGRNLGGSSTNTKDGCTRRMSSFNFEASAMNCWTWPKENAGYSLLKAPTVHKLREDIYITVGL